MASVGGEQLWRLSLIHLVQFFWPWFLFFFCRQRKALAPLSIGAALTHGANEERARRDTNPRVVHLQPFVSMRAMFLRV